MCKETERVVKLLDKSNLFESTASLLGAAGWESRKRTGQEVQKIEGKTSEASLLTPRPVHASVCTLYAGRALMKNASLLCTPQPCSLWDTMS